MPTDTSEQIQAAAERLRDQGVDLVIAKLGTKGSLLMGKGKTVQQDIIKADKVTLSANALFSVSAAGTAPLLQLWPRCCSTGFAFAPLAAAHSPAHSL